MVRALQSLGEKVQVAVTTAERLQCLDGREHVIAVDPGAPMPFTHEPQLMVERQIDPHIAGDRDRRNKRGRSPAVPRCPKR